MCITYYLLQLVALYTAKMEGKKGVHVMAMVKYSSAIWLKCRDSDQLKWPHDLKLEQNGCSMQKENREWICTPDLSLSLFLPGSKSHIYRVVVIKYYDQFCARVEGKWRL